MASAVTIGELLGEVLADLTTASKSFADVQDYGAVGNGVTDCRTAFAAADTAGLGIVVRGGTSATYKIASNLTISSVVIFGYGAKVSVPTGVTLTLAGGVIASSAQQLFTCAGTGKVVFSQGQQTAYPEWFGAVADDSTDCAAAANLCVSALSGGGEIIFGHGTYRLSVPIDLAANFGTTLRGKGKHNTILSSPSGSASLIRFNTSIVWTDHMIYNTLVQIEDMEFHADSTTAQNLVSLSTRDGAVAQPPRVMAHIRNCRFEYTDHTTNRASIMVYLHNIQGVRFLNCDFEVAYASLQSGLEYGLGVKLDGAGANHWVQDVNFTDCSWYFINGVYASGASGDCEGVLFQNCRMVGQGINSVDPYTGHYGVTAVIVTDFQWRGGENTGVTGFNFDLDSGGPYTIESTYVSNNRDASGSADMGMITVRNTIGAADLFISHCLFEDDGGHHFGSNGGDIGYMINLYNTTGSGYFGTVHDNIFQNGDTLAVNFVNSPGGGIDYTMWHHNFHNTTALATGFP